MISPERLDEVGKQLSADAVSRISGYVSGKLFMGDGRFSKATPWLHLQLSDVDRFVRERMQIYHDRKQSDRLFFADDLI